MTMQWRATALVFGLGALLSVALMRPVVVRNDALPTTTPVVALSSGAESDSQLDERGEARLREAIAVARQTKSPKLLTTRSVTNGVSSDVGQERLVRGAGLESLWTVLPGLVRTTREEALALRLALPESAAVIVVTSPSHTLRACAAIERVGLRVTCHASTDRPSATDNAYERLARIKYRHNGWLR